MQNILYKNDGCEIHYNQRLFYDLILEPQQVVCNTIMEIQDIMFKVSIGMEQIHVQADASLMSNLIPYATDLKKVSNILSTVVCI